MYLIIASDSTFPGDICPIDKEVIVMKRHMFLFLCLLIILFCKGGHAMSDQNSYRKATFAGGCFWCLEPPFEKLNGVIDVVSGYIGGSVDNPTYEQVCTGNTGHYEAVEVTFDPDVISYEQLLETFWRQIDPTDPGGQFADRGSQYKTAIFYHSDHQKERARQSKENLDQSGLFDKPIVTEILPADTFYKAEAYHQDYYKTCPVRYKMYRKGSGREDFIDAMWNANR